MKAKTILVIGTLHFFGVVVATPQVRQEEAVGFVNLLLLPGYNLVANQLNATPNNVLSNVLTGLPVETQVLTYNNAFNNYELELFDGETWIKPDGTPGTLSADPGSAMFIFNPDSDDNILTLVGSVPEGPNLAVPLLPGFSLVAWPFPQSVPLTRDSGFPQIPESQVIFWNPVTQNYDEPVFNVGFDWIRPDGTFAPAPTVEVGQGFFFFNPGPLTFWPE